ncbi:MAG: lysophospholipid acyltransferase family protein [Sphingobium sp.]
MTMLRRWRRLAALIGSLLICLPLHLVWKLLRRHSPWPHIFFGLAARSVGARVSTSGVPRTHDVFFVCNHVSWIDILAMGGATGTAFIAHDGIARWPIVGWLAAQNNTIFVARERRHGVGEQLNTLREALMRHQSVALFPEGTTSDGATLLPFKPALFAGLMPPPRDLDIQPVFIDYGAATSDIAWYGSEPAGTNAWRLLARKGPLPITLHFLDPFDPEHLPDRKAVAAEARKRIDSAQNDCTNAFRNAFAQTDAPV